MGNLVTGSFQKAYQDGRAGITVTTNPRTGEKRTGFIWNTQGKKIATPGKPINIISDQNNSTEKVK